MDNEITKWIQIYYDENADEKDKSSAFRKFHDFYHSQLLAQIDKEIGKDVQQRVGKSEIMQEVWLSFYKNRDASFNNRKALFGYLDKVALNKVREKGTYHRRKKRDPNREVSPEQNGDESKGDLLERVDARPPLPQGRLKKERMEDWTTRGSEDPESFYQDGIVELMTYGRLPDHAAIFKESFEKLVEMNAHEIMELHLQRYTNKEIAEKLDISVAKVERKIAIIRHEYGEPDLP